jgi:hypothetical protein
VRRAQARPKTGDPEEPTPAVGLFDHLPGVRHDRLADGRHLNRAVGALKDPDAQFVLQLLDLTAQRRLADKSALRRPAEIAGLCDGDGVFEIPEFYSVVR